jgi:hypothetical protein
VPLEEIGHDTASLGNKIAECIAPGGEEFGNEHANQYDTAWYLITELANNVRQHSRGLGFISAQRTISDGFVKLAFGDCGCGIPTSLRDALPDSTRDLPDEDVIEKALVARISSKGPPANQGVGLTLSARIVSLMDGSLLIASGNGIVVRQPAVISVKRNLLGGGRFPGTLIAITFPFDGASDFNGKLLKAKELEKLLPSSPRSVSFQA